MDRKSRISTVGHVLGTTLNLFLTIGPLVVALLSAGKRRQEPDKEQVGPGHRRDSTTQKEYPAGQIAHAVTQLQPPETEIEERKRYQRKQAGRDKMRLAIEALALFTLFVGTAIALYTLFGLWNTISLNERSLHIDQRAWIAINTRTYRIDEKTASFTVGLGLMNTGKSPARTVTPRIRVDVGPFDRPDWSTVKPSTPFVLFANTAGYEVPSEPHPTPPDGRTIYTRALLTYIDVFGDSHWTEFCASHAIGTNPGAFSLCQTDNTEGDGEPPKN
jgi:hypothetical protein